MNFLKASGCALTVPQLFLAFPYKKLKTTCKLCEKVINDRHRDKLVSRIFRDHYKEVIEDIIDNNVTFELPLMGHAKCELHMQAVRGEEFKRLRQHRKWLNIDYYASNFTGYRLALFIHSTKRPTKIKYVYVNKRLKDKLDENVNNQKTYC